MPPEIVGAIIGAIISGIITWNFTKSDLGQKNNLLEAQIRDSNQQIKTMSTELSIAEKQAERLRQFETKYQNVRNRLQASSVVKEYIQPVILVGPRSVGKTSLLAQWHAPWDHSILDPTARHSTSTVPIYDFKRENTEKHFADPEILTDVHVHLKLKVYDFPGELRAQKSIIEETIQATQTLRQSTEKSLGVVLICMFDVQEVIGGLSQPTIDYYNGELFGSLRRLVAHNQVGIERLILVFNKYDLLKQKRRNYDDETLLKQALETFRPLILLLRGIVNPEKVCEVFTILDRDDVTNNNRGAPIVMGEASRKFVEIMAGKEAARKVVKESATQFASDHFLQ